MYKIILVKQDYGYEDDDPTLDVKEVSLGELLNDPDPEIQAHLAYSGWVNLKKAKDVEAKLVLNKKFYVVANERVYGLVKQINDLDKMQGFEITNLANGAVLLQEVSLRSVLSDEQWRLYSDVKRRLDEQKKKDRLSQEQKAAKKKAKEIEKAKKVLQEHGVKVSDEERTAEGKPSDS